MSPDRKPEPKSCMHNQTEDGFRHIPTDAEISSFFCFRIFPYSFFSLSCLHINRGSFSPTFFFFRCAADRGQSEGIGDFVRRSTGRKKDNSFKGPFPYVFVPFARYRCTMQRSSFMREKNNVGTRPCLVSLCQRVISPKW
jgi:hypothetical protein